MVDRKERLVQDHCIVANLKQVCAVNAGSPIEEDVRFCVVVLRPRGKPIELVCEHGIFGAWVLRSRPSQCCQHDVFGSEVYVKWDPMRMANGVRVSRFSGDLDDKPRGALPTRCREPDCISAVGGGPFLSGMTAADNCANVAGYRS